MTLTTALLALVLRQTQAPAPDFSAPKEVAAPPAEILGWRGWGYLNGAPGHVDREYLVGNDWTSVKNVYEHLSPPAKPAVWRTRIVLFTDVTELGHDAYGIPSALRRRMEDAEVAMARMEIGRFTAQVAAVTDGRVQVLPEISVENASLTDGGKPEFAQRYFGSRINGGGYEPEDKIYRGPYAGIFYVLPGSVSAKPTSLYGSPISGLGLYSESETLSARLLDAWLQQIGTRLHDRGLSVGDAAASGGVADWSEVVDRTEVKTPTLLERLGAKTAFIPGFDPTAKQATITAWRTAKTDVTLDTDTDKGSVLKYAERGFGRDGGMLFPTPEGKPIADLGQTPTLTVRVRSAAVDPIAIRLDGDQGHQAYVVLGRDRGVPVALPSIPSLSVPLTKDGTWQTVSVNLRDLAAKAGITQVKRMALEPTPAMRLFGREQLTPIEYVFDDIRFTGDAGAAPLDAPKPLAASTDAVERGLFAAQATASSPELVALLTDPERKVRRAAALAYTRLNDPAAVPNLVKLVTDIDPWIATAGLEALSHQGGEIADFTIRQTVRIGVTEPAKATAARILAQGKDPKVSGEIVSLLAARQWTTRLAALQALTQIPGPEAGILRMAFLSQEDPEIKLAAVRSAEPAEEFQMRKLLWTAVNEPSDLVRAESDIKLIQSPNPTIRAEGYKGVKDDSVATRLLVLDYLVSAPNEAHRSALQLAVADRTASVRAAALRGFAALEKGASAEEIANVMEDRTPQVQIALADLAKRRGLKLPAAAVAAMRTSPDPQVRAAAEGLNG